MMLYILSVVFISTLIALSDGQGFAVGPKCSNVEGCHCGDQCIDVSDLKLCHSKSCRCMQGCVVGRIFIPPGVSRENTYCNTCTCPSGRSSGTPACSRRAWCNLPPPKIPLYQRNPACRTENTGEY